MLDISLNGRNFRSQYFYSDDSKQKNNINIIRKFVETLGGNYEIYNDESPVWSNISRDLVMEFLNKYDHGLNHKKLYLDFVLQSDYKQWDVVINSKLDGENMPITDNIIIYKRNSQTSEVDNKTLKMNNTDSPDVYGVNIADEHKEEFLTSTGRIWHGSREKLNKYRKNPLLVITIMDSSNSDEYKDVPILSLIFPGDKHDVSQSINIPVIGNKRAIEEQNRAFLYSYDEEYEYDEEE